MGRLYKITSTWCATVALLAFTLGVLSLNQARGDDDPPTAQAVFNCGGCAAGIQEGNPCAACWLCGCALPSCATCICQGIGGNARGCF